ncbi:FABP family protein [Agromyces archimandritae]|uniref:Peroxynitrite isomerase n=1 Tax=Agromyces archimandritae TaxID=2781962 RepID=A0A975FL89_9MICO|nr:FABP family protein [Agromyces archimandritae]QTX03972.1 FABP family protein [Agromyces archimandritae]
MIELPVDLPAELVPLSWLIGVWEGTGVIDYAIDEGVHVTREFGQRLSFGHDGLPYLNYTSSAWLLPADGEGGADAEPEPLGGETGYWRLDRPLEAGDPGPGMLPARGERPYPDAESVERLRNADGGFDLQVQIVQPGGVGELYLGQVKGPRIDLATDAVMRAPGAKEYAAASRLYGLVDGHLLWAWDMAALGNPLVSHASARLAKAAG